MLTKEEIEELTNLSSYTIEWDYEGYLNSNKKYYGTQIDWNETLLTKINILNNTIKQNTGNIMNYIYVSNKFAPIIYCNSYFTPLDIYEESGKVGMLHNTFPIYVNQSLPPDWVLIGNDDYKAIIQIKNFI